MVANAILGNSWRFGNGVWGGRVWRAELLPGPQRQPYFYLRWLIWSALEVAKWKTKLTPHSHDVSSADIRDKSTLVQLLFISMKPVQVNFLLAHTYYQ